NEASLSEVKIDGHISSAAYHRLLVERLLPLSIKTALYLDSDIIINDDISDLLHLDVSGHVLAAVPDAWCDRNKIVRSKIQLKESARYFNSGVLLLNLEIFRSEQIGLRALKFCISNSQSSCCEKLMDHLDSDSASLKGEIAIHTPDPAPHTARSGPKT